MDYNPNLTHSGPPARQTVRLTFQQWRYEAKTIEVVIGNVSGFLTFESAIANLHERLTREQRTARMQLRDPNGATLLCEDDEGLGEEWLQRMLVKAEILTLEPDALLPEAEAIGDDAFLNPPDGGDVSLAEQVRRMREALAQSATRPAQLLEDDHVCSNCGESLPTGCQGLFKSDGDACWLNRKTETGS